ncbi:MAG TPA: hypothetical protein VEI02_01540 [Planctomycetota bacterium]|nr:hypothetical protein [Planctomycetota bacterium]
MEVFQPGVYLAVPLAIVRTADGGISRALEKWAPTVVVNAESTTVEVDLPVDADLVKAVKELSP